MLSRNPEFLKILMPLPKTNPKPATAERLARAIEVLPRNDFFIAASVTRMALALPEEKGKPTPQSIAINAMRHIAVGLAWDEAARPKAERAAIVWGSMLDNLFPDPQEALAECCQAMGSVMVGMPLYRESHRRALKMMRVVRDKADNNALVSYAQRLMRPLPPPPPVSPEPSQLSIPCAMPLIDRPHKVNVIMSRHAGAADRAYLLPAGSLPISPQINFDF